MMEALSGPPLRAVMSLEIGGGNALQPLLAAATLGYPGGRRRHHGPRLPEAQMTSFAVGDLTPWPLRSGRHPRQRGDRRARADLEMDGAHRRKICVEFGSPRLRPARRRGPAREVKRWGIHGTRRPRRSRSAAAVREARAATPTRSRPCWPASEGGLALPRQDHRRGAAGDRGLPARHRRPSTGWTTTAAAALWRSTSRTSSVGVARRRSEVTTPDLICVLDSVSGEAIGTETLRYGQRVDGGRPAGAGRSS
jgi:DUF917 family protein